MQAIEIKGRRNLGRLSDWYRAAALAAVVALAAIAVLMVLATGGRTSAGGSVPSYGHMPAATHGSLPGDDASALPAQDSLPTRGNLP